jgi:hypothetical protein
MVEESEDVLTRIAGLRDEEYETACLILARVERIDNTMIRVNERLRTIDGYLHAIKGSMATIGRKPPSPRSANCI